MVNLGKVMIGLIGAHSLYYAFNESKINPETADWSKRVASAFLVGTTVGLNNTIILPVTFINDKIIEFKNNI